MSFPKWPSWRFGPGGQSAVFESEADVPKGWVDHPSKVKGEAKEPAPAKSEAKQPAKAPAAAASAELDADGHAYDPALHAGTGSKTKAGLWRMKVGVARPAPAPGYPLDL
jgi:hypothetical protein